MTMLTRRKFTFASAVAAGVVAAPGLIRAAPSRAFDRDRFIEDVTRALPQGQGAVEAVITRALATPRAIWQGLQTPEAAAIQLLYRDAGLSIFNIVWPPYAVIGPHDHLMWASIGVYAGREDNIVWHKRAQGLEATGAASIAAGRAFSLPVDAIHSVTNPTHKYTAAIHIYGGDLTDIERSQWDPLTLKEEPFNVEDGRRILREADRRARL